MEHTNQYWSNDFETSTNIDASIREANYLLKGGDTLNGALILDGSLIIRGFNDTSLYWIGVNVIAEPSAYLVQ